MPVSDLIQQTVQYEAFLKQFSPTVTLRYILAEGTFISQYQKDLPIGGGVYVIRTPDEIVYVGKADQFSRIWWHTRVPVISRTGQKEFVNCRFLTDETLTQISDSVKDEILLGNFFVDYIAVNPVTICPAVETFLQSAYYLNYHRLPAGCRRIG